MAKGLSDSRASELVTALQRTSLSSTHGLQTKRDGTRVVVYLGAAAAAAAATGGGGGRPTVGDRVKLKAGYESQGDASDGPLKPGDTVSSHDNQAFLVV